MQINDLEVEIQDVENHDIGSHTMAMLKLISQGEEDIKNGRVVSQHKVFSELEKWMFLD